MRRCTGLLILPINNQRPSYRRRKKEDNMNWWPGWNSIEGVAKWGDIFFWAVFSFLCLLVGCEVLSKVYGWRKDTLIVMRNDLVVVAADKRTKQAEQELAEAQERQEAALAAARAREAEAEKALAEPP